MPWSARRPCRQPGCARLAVRGKVYCEVHAGKEYDRQRGTASQRGYNADWRLARADFLAENPLCAECRKRGKLEPATRVDHVIPHRGDRRLFWDRSNWQSLCETCHNRKTAKGE